MLRGHGWCRLVVSGRSRPTAAAAAAAGPARRVLRCHHHLRDVRPLHAAAAPAQWAWTNREDSAWRWGRVASPGAHGANAGPGRAALTLLGLGLFLAAAMPSLNQDRRLASCQEAGATNDGHSQEQDDGKEEGDFDPYDNLPEEDEETSCSMCNTFRKGPCRPYWRKLERCFKDHEKEENGAVKCMRYFNPHHQCLSQYTNLYQLVSLEQKQELVQDIQKSVTKGERRAWEPDIDWAMWKRFCNEDNGLAMKPQTVKTPKGTPYWQRLPENTEPLLVSLESHLPHQDANGLLLKIAFAVDQDGIVIGLTFNSEYGKLMDQANGKTKEDQSTTSATATGSNDDSDKAADCSEENEGTPQLPASTMSFEFYVLPGETKKVRLYGLYSENPLSARADKDILDATLYKSKAYSLAQMAKENTAYSK